MKRAGTLKVSKKTSAAFSLFLLGLRGASVSSTGCCKIQKTQTRQWMLKYPISEMCDLLHCYKKRGAHLLWESLQLLLGINVLPDPLHVVPVLHYPVFHRIPHRQQAPVLLINREAVTQNQHHHQQVTSTDGFITCFMAQEKHCSNKLTHDREPSRLVFA